MNDDLRAEIRAANLKGERLDGGGDNRPPVYQDSDGRWVYRASSVGGLCERALWLARMGVEPSPTPEALTVAFTESANNEPLAIQLFEDGYGITVDRRQERFEIPVDDSVVIRGHVDGVGHTTDTDPIDGVVEVKCIAEGSWERRGVGMYPAWLPQVQLAMKGLGLRVAWEVYGRKVDGVVDRVAYDTVTFNPRVVAEVVAKVRRVERAVRTGEHVDCDGERWGCPYWTLHEGAEEQEIEDRGLAALARQVLDRAGEVRRAEEQLKTLRTRLTERLRELKVSSGVIVGKGTRVKVRVVTPTRQVWDEEKLAADGVELDRYRTRVEGTPYVKVEEDR